MTLAERVWELLPGRTDRARVATASVLAAHLAVTPAEVTVALHAMERTGHAIRDRRTGTRASNWHRGLPLPTNPDPDPEPERGQVVEVGLW